MICSGRTYQRPGHVHFMTRPRTRYDEMYHLYPTPHLALVFTQIVLRGAGVLPDYGPVGLLQPGEVGKVLCHAGGKTV